MDFSVFLMARNDQSHGEGPRPPRLGGSLANDIAEQTIVVEKPGC